MVQVAVPCQQEDTGAAASRDVPITMLVSSADDRLCMAIVLVSEECAI